MIAKSAPLPFYMRDTLKTILDYFESDEQDHFLSQLNHEEATRLDNILRERPIRLADLDPMQQQGNHIYIQLLKLREFLWD